jgi:membrane associated rhomboid family serine protease
MRGPGTIEGVSYQRETGDVTTFGSQAFYASLGRAFVTMCAVIPLLFLIEAIDQGLGGGYLDAAGGIIPRRIQGLDGVLFSPFLHADWGHLYGNAVPLILVGTFALAGGARRFVYSTAVIMLISGLGVWLIGNPNSVVVGASGVIFGYLGLLVTRGFVEHSWWNLGVAAFIGLLYWYQLYNVLPTDQPISWQGHLLGLLGGAVAAVLFRRRRTQPAYTGPSTTLTGL